MPEFVVFSERDRRVRLADCCVFELEDALVDALGADLATASAPPPPGRRYDVAFIAGVHLKELATAVHGAAAAKVGAAHWCGYVLGAHPVDAEKLHSFLYRTLKPSSRGLDRLDSLFVGFDHGADAIGATLHVPTRCAPIAVDLLKVGAAIGPRPIAVNGFGRQEQRYSNLLSDRMNRPGSPHFYYHTNAVNISGAADWRRYRDLFWQALRMSRIAVAFDQLYYNPSGHQTASHVGPRWMESLGAGAVVVGKAPRTPEAAALMDWPDATIELEDDPETAVEQTLALLDDGVRLEAAARRNLEHMHGRHDWRHRFSDILAAIGVSAPASLADQLAELDRRRQRFAAATAPSPVAAAQAR